MNSEFIPVSIKQNINFDWNNQQRIEELNNMFKEIHKSDSEIKQTNDYKKLISEINCRIDAEYKAKQSNLNREKKEKELIEAKKKLDILRNSNSDLKI
tara:strand:- start:3 stop:296 length:294 start_codon:yes stop_codon:yes gene_type:complete